MALWKYCERCARQMHDAEADRGWSVCGDCKLAEARSLLERVASARVFGDVSDPVAMALDWLAANPGTEAKR